MRRLQPLHHLRPPRTALRSLAMPLCLLPTRRDDACCLAYRRVISLVPPAALSDNAAVRADGQAAAVTLVGDAAGRIHPVTLHGHSGGWEAVAAAVGGGGRHAAECLAVGETVILLHPPLPVVGVSIGQER